jgi:hypothetical protein
MRTWKKGWVCLSNLSVVANRWLSMLRPREPILRLIPVLSLLERSSQIYARIWLICMRRVSVGFYLRRPYSDFKLSFANHSEGGDKKKAMARLRPTLKSKSYHSSAAWTGLFIGSALFTLCAGLWRGRYRSFYLLFWTHSRSSVSLHTDRRGDHLTVEYTLVSV